MTDLINKIHLGDGLELIKQLPDDSVDLLITDPPYIVKVNKHSGKGNNFSKSLEKFRDSRIHDIKDNFNISNYFNEWERVLKKFNAFIFCSNAQISRIANEGEKRGHFVTILVWHKTNTAPFANGVWRSDLEYTVHIRQSGATFHGGAREKSKIYISPTEVSKYGHPTEKPVKLIEKYMKIGSNEGDLILDSFMGSGTTAQVAINNNRNFIGYEIDETYHDTACNRVARSHGNVGLFS